MSSRTVRFATFGLIAFALCVATMFVTRPGTSSHATAAEANNAKINALLKERHATLVSVVETVRTAYEIGRASLIEVSEATIAAQRAELELCKTDRERVVVLEKMLMAARGLEDVAKAQYETASGSNVSVLKAKADRLEIEIALERVRAK